MIGKEVHHTESFNRVIGDKHNSVTMTLSIHPNPDCPAFKQVKLVQLPDSEHINIKKRQLQAVNNGVLSCLRYGKSAIHPDKLQFFWFKISVKVSDTLGLWYGEHIS